MRLLLIGNELGWSCDNGRMAIRLHTPEEWRFHVVVPWVMGVKI